MSTIKPIVKFQKVILDFVPLDLWRPFASYVASSKADNLN
ncbi:hypothetical protein JOD18_000948 [Gracilibacillus alcaliphilus]|nr:hypothetical protein [Gracilibacillus alcaliphilus]